MKLRNLSNRNVVLRDTIGVIYEIPAYGDTDLNSSLWSDVEFRRTLRLRVRDINISDDTATALATVINAPNAATTPLIIAGFTGQSANLMEWKNVGGTVLTSISAAGILTTPGLVIANTSTSTEPVTIKAVVAQTAALQSWRDSANAKLLQISTLGKIEFGSSQDTNLYRNAANQLKTDDQFFIQRTNGTDLALSINIATDVNDAFTILANGKHAWGPGATATDTTLYRSTSATLKTDGDFELENILRLKGATGTITFGSANDVSIGRGGADLLVTSDTLRVTAPNSSAIGLIVKGVSGQTADLFQVQAFDGSVLFRVTAAGSSSGAVASGTAITLSQNDTAALTLSGTGGGITFGPDTTLFRLGANSLRTPGAFSSAAFTANTGTASQIRIGNGSALIEFGQSADVNLYRSAADTLKTDDALIVVGTLNAGNTTLGTLNAGNTSVGTLAAGTTTITGTLSATTLSATTINAVTNLQVGGVALASTHLSDGAGLAPKASPALTGTPTAPTAAVDTNTTQVATTAYVVGQGYAKLASPALTGNPTAPTQSPGNNSTRVATTAYADAAVAAIQTVPAGALFMTATATAPAGYLLCDGSLVSRTTYAALFAAISTAYGVGDGSTTFGIPDLRGRIPVGKGTHADVSTLGNSDGLSVGARRPKHKHTVNDPGHSHGYERIVGGPANIAAGGDFTNANVQTNSATTGISVGPQTGNEPVDAPAYVVVNYIIKT